MLKRPQATQQINNILSASQQTDNNQKSQQMDKMKLDRLLRKPRSKDYLQAMRTLDAGGHVHNQDKVNEIINMIRNEFPEVELSGVMLGIVSVCNLGIPYVVHTLNISGQILIHYKGGQSLPGKLEKARSIAIRGGYEFIEVYTDCLRAVSSNGSVSVMSY